MLLDFFPDGRQSVREGDNMLVLGAFAYLTKAHVISVLLAAFRVSPGRLNVANGEKAYPDVRPRRRNRERLDPLEQAIADGFCGHSRATRQTPPRRSS
jgi:hypothetical protein